MGVPRYSVIITAYKELGHALENILKLARDDVEFIVSADMLPEKAIKKLKDLSERYPIVLDLSSERRGKVNSLNDALSKAHGDIIVFIDSDARVLREDLLDLISKALENADFGTGIIQVQGKSFLENMARIDYLAMNTTMYVGARLKFSTGLNGAFMFARREVVESIGGFEHEIVEDVDFAVRASFAGFRPVYIQVPCVETGAPSSWRSWYKQRRRWLVGGGALVVKFWRASLRKLKKIVPQVLSVNPVLVALLPIFLMPNRFVYKAILLLATVLAAVFPLLLPFLYASIVYGFARQLLILLVGFCVLFPWFLYWKHRFMFKRVKKRHIVLYYFIYGPVWSALTLFWVAYAIAKKGKVSLPDWKV